MKKLVIISIFIGCSFSLRAQKSKIIGNWLLTKVEVNNKVHEPYFITNYKADGTLEMMGMEAGTWKFDEKANKIIMKSNFDKKFNGDNIIVSLTKRELIVAINEAKLFYVKLDSEKIIKQNSTSKLVGEWELENEFDEIKLLKIELPDTFLLTEISAGGGSSSTTKGTWIYNSKQESVLFIGRSRLLEGKSIIKELSENTFLLVKNGLEIVAKKQISTTDIERLTFSIEDFSEEQTENSPWQDFDALLNGLKNLKYLKYKQSKLIPNTKSFRYKTLLSKIKVNSKERRISLRNLSINQNDTMQYSESVKGHLYNQYNNFFPQEEPGPYRMVATETIEVPAGTFNCKVFEGFDGDAKIKYWMILDKPGVYAKVIREDVSHFDELQYSISELEEIK